MLVRFAVENFFSVRERQELSMVATAASRESHAFSTHKRNPSHLLRVCAIFGPNASGKTTLIRALSTLRRLVRRSHRIQRGDEIEGITPHLFDKRTAGSPSKFEIAFIAEGLLYEYGIALTGKKIVEEWLTRTKTSKRQLLFERTAKMSGSTFYINPILTGRHKAWTEETLDNMLLLSKIVSFNNAQLKPVYDWFSNVLKPPIFRRSAPSILRYSQKQFSRGDSKYRDSVLAILKALDLGVADAKVSEEEVSLDPEIKEIFRAAALKMMDTKEFVTKLLHVTNNGVEVELPFDDESDGTQRLFALVGPLLLALRDGNVLFVDELHNSLHPLATRFLVSLFQNSNPKNGQLVFSTHDPTMLRSEILHRDEIWFVERDSNHSTKLTALSEFKERAGVDYEERYLKGRYGGIPHIYAMLTGLSPNETKTNKGLGNPARHGKKQAKTRTQAPAL